MAWLWSSWQEYVDAVQPRVVKSPVLLRLAQTGSLFGTECRLFEATSELEAGLNTLDELGFAGDKDNHPPEDAPAVTEAKTAILEVINAGERLLLFNKRLALSGQAYGFLHSHDLLDHWDRYGTVRRHREIHQIVEDTRQLLTGYHEMVTSDEDFLVGEIDLPQDLETDFLLARNLFSVGQDEVALLIAGRGLEAVLRKIARVRKIKLLVKGKLRSAQDVDFYDLIETMYRVKWRRNGTHFLR